MSEQNQNQEPEKDEHGCVVGKERWDAENEKCVPIETVKEQQDDETDEHKQFMAQCLESAKQHSTLHEILLRPQAVWEEETLRQETHESQLRKACTLNESLWPTTTN